MKRFICLIIPIMLILSQCCSAAAPISSYELKTETNGIVTQKIKISGEAPAGSFVSLRVYKNGMSISDYESGSDAFEVFSALKQTVAKADGTYTFEFPFSAAYSAAGVNADIYIESSAGPISIVFQMADTQSVNDFYNSANREIGSPTLTSTILKNYIISTSSGLDTEFYNAVIAADASKEADMLSELLDRINTHVDGGNRLTPEVFKPYFEEVVLLDLFEASSDGTVLSNAIEGYKDSLDLTDMSNGANELLTAYNSFADKGSFLTENIKGTYSDYSALAEAFKEQVFLTLKDECKIWTDVKTFINDNIKYLADKSVDLTEYNESDDNKETISKYIVLHLSEATSIATFSDVFDDGSDTCGVSPTPTPNSPGNQGSSGGSSGTKLTVGSEFAEIPTPAIPAVPSLSDIGGHWGEEAIKSLAADGIINGFSDNTYRPEDNVTREEFIKIVISALFDDIDGFDAEFTDVEKDRWSYKYIAFASANGIATGKGDGSFVPDENITRQDMAIILYRAMLKKEQIIDRDVIDTNYTDFDSISDYAQNGVVMLSHMGIVRGNDGYFRPLDFSTRAEAAQMIYNLLQKG